jgi:hypothetical protein
VSGGRRSTRAALAAGAVVFAAGLGVGAAFGGCGAVRRSDQVEPSRAEVLGATSERSSPPPRVESPSTTAAVARPETPAATTTTAAAAGGVPPARPLRPATTTGGAQPSGSAGTSGDRDARIDAALASVHFDWRHLLPGWTLAFLGPRSGLQGNTLPGSRRVEIYVRPTFTTGQLAQVIAHEIGHAVDVSYFDDADRRAFNVLRGRDPGAAWWVADGQSDFASGAGDWAESFASWATGGLGTWASRLGPPPDAAQRAAIGRLLSAAIG